MNNEQPIINSYGKTTLRISLIPLIVIIAVIVGAGYFLMKDEIKIPWFNNEPRVRRLEGFPTVVYTDKQVERIRKVVKSEDELNQLLNTVDSSGLLTLKEKINFNKEVLLFVATDTQTETEHTIKVQKIYEDKQNQKFLVSVREVEAGKNCQVEQTKNIAIDIVAVNKTDLNFTFDRAKEVRECKDGTPDTKDGKDITKESTKNSAQQ